MSLHEAEKRRSNRDEVTTDDADCPDDEADETDRPTGVLLVAALAFFSGLTDLLAGATLAAGALAVIGLPVAALGAAKCWAAVGLYRVRARGLGFTLLFFGFGAAVSAGELLFAVGSGGDLPPPLGALALDLAVIGYLITVADAFE